MYHFRKKPSLIIEHPVYEYRLNKLVDGYNRSIIFIAHCDITYFITKYLYHLDDDKLIFQKVCDGKTSADDLMSFGMEQKEEPNYMQLQVEMEIFIKDEFTSKVVNTSNIKYYHIDYKYIEQEPSSDILVTIEIENRDSMITNKIYPKNGIGFVNVPASIIRSLLFSFQVIAMDENHNMMIKSDWITFEQYPHQIPMILTSNADIANQYFDKYIDIENDGFLEIDDWVSALRKLEDFKEFSVCELRRIFYYMMFVGGNDGNGILEIERTDFYEFIACNDYDILERYHGVYKRFIDIVRSKIPDLFDTEQIVIIT